MRFCLDRAYIIARTILRWIRNDARAQTDDDERVQSIRSRRRNNNNNDVQGDLFFLSRGHISSRGEFKKYFWTGSVELLFIYNLKNL